MHLKEALLRPYLDGALPEAQLSQVRKHLKQCSACQARLDTIAARERGIHQQLDALLPGPKEQPSAQSAYRRITTNLRYTSKHKEKTNQMFTKRSFWTALSAIAVLTLIFTITPARAWASSFLSLFRVENVQVVTFDPDAVANARNQMEANRAVIEQIFDEDLEVTENGTSVEVGSIDEASAAAGFAARLPGAFTDPVIMARPGMNAIFTINQPKLQSLLDVAEIGIQIPESADGQVVTVDVSQSVSITSGCMTVEGDENQPENCANFIQMPSPVVNAPDELDVPKMGEAMFQFLGLAPEEARSLSQRIDWTTTLVLPIPNTGQLQYKDVQVDGVTGTLIREEENSLSMLIWVKGGILYGLSVPGGEEEVLAAAASLR